jgi:hypothetical protein
MPVYTYQIINDDGAEGETFEVVRKMSDPPLKQHPDTGQVVKRIFQPIHIAGITHESHNKNRLSEKNLEKQGFTKYQRNGKGHYERTVGKAGPDSLHVD